MRRRREAERRGAQASAEGRWNARRASGACMWRGWWCRRGAAAWQARAQRPRGVRLQRSIALRAPVLSEARR